MEKVTLWFSQEEMEVLNDCVTITNVRGQPLLRILLMRRLEELQEEIKETKSITCTFPVQSFTEKVDRKNRSEKVVFLASEMKADYDAILGKLPVKKSEFLKFLLLPELMKIQDKKVVAKEVSA